MNTETGLPQRHQGEPLDADAFELPEPRNGSGVSTLADAVAQLEDDLNTERDERKEERFRWICLSALLFDVIAFPVINHFGAFLLIFLFQTVIILGTAQRLGLDWAVKLLGSFYHWMLENLKIRG